jgi:hypothetical protein
MPPRWRGAQEQELTNVEQRSVVGGAVEAKILARWSCKLGQKECTSEGSKPSKGIKEWIGSVTTSRLRRNGRAHLGGEEQTTKGGYFPLVWVLIAGGEREGAVRPRRAFEPLFLVDDGWPSVGSLKLVRPKWPNGCTVATLTRYQGLNEFQIELSCKMEKA